MIRNAVFLGSKEFGLTLLKSLFYCHKKINWTVLCPPDENDERSCFEKFKCFSRKNNIKILTVKSPKHVVKYAEEINPDVVIVSGYYRILPAEFLSKVTHGVWGIHNSKLPKYRGGSPLVWQIINDEKLLGSSFFKFEDGVDEGAILDQFTISNDPKVSIQQALDIIQNEWKKRLPLLWARFCEGKIKAREQNHSEATYCAQRYEFDGSINWNLKASSIDSFINAQMEPYPKAFFFLNRKKIKIVEHSTDERITYGTAGQVFEIKKNYVTICCGNNTIIRLNKLEIDGKIVSACKIITSIRERIEFNY